MGRIGCAAAATAPERDRVIINFVFPSGKQRAGGVIALYEFANGLVRRGHDVHFVHGPAWPTRVDRLDELPEFPFEPELHHHIVDSLDDPELVAGDIAFMGDGPPRLGLPAVFVQGYKMWLEHVEQQSFRLRCPKVCIARWLVDVGASLGVDRAQLWHVPMGMDHELFALRTPLDARQYDVAMLLHPHREKGWDVGRQALEELGRRMPGARSLVFGRVPPREPLPAGVEFRHSPDHDALAEEIYNASRVFVQTSHNEGFGFTAVEAMACGSALVTTDNGGSRDYAIPGETAWVVPAGDVQGVADGMEALLRDDGARQDLARAGERYVRRFDWDLGAATLESKLEAYLADPAAYQRAPDPASAVPDVDDDEIARYLADPANFDPSTLVANRNKEAR